MERQVDWVDGWEVRPRADGSFIVGDDHGIIAGPFGTKEQAIAAALQLPKRAEASAARPAGTDPGAR